MAEQNQPSYTDLVYEVLRSSAEPVSFDDILKAVDARRQIKTKNPSNTIRGILNGGWQLVSVGRKRWTYLPHLIKGSTLRFPLPGVDCIDEPLIYPVELRLALWTGFFESGKRGHHGPVSLLLPNGQAADLSLTFLTTDAWGCSTPEDLASFLIDREASDSDALLIRVIDVEARQAEATFERRVERDDAAIAERNQSLADAAAEAIAKRYTSPVFGWEIAKSLLMRGFYQEPIPPDPLEDVLGADDRFVHTGLFSWTLDELLTPEDRRFFEMTDNALAALMELADDERIPDGPPMLIPPPSPAAARGSMERTLSDITALLSEQDFESIDEANAFLEGIVTSGQLVHHGETPLDRAQDLIYEAWEAPTPQKAIRLAKKALKDSPDCADAYVLLGDLSARTPAQAADFYAQGVAAGERALGPEAFSEDVGGVWGILETRPYMRARLSLAQALWVMGQTSEAIEHLWEMLRLNPGDNQGIRYPLLCWLLESGDDTGAERLFKLYPDDGSANWFYGQVLHALRTPRGGRRAEKLLEQAIKWNPHVPAYLLGTNPLPLEPPAYMSRGDESEAVDCVINLAGAWYATPGATEWLAQHTS